MAGKSPFKWLCYTMMASLLFTTALPVHADGTATAQISTESTKVENLKVNYQKNPIGIESDSISFSWMLASNVVGLSQKAYRIAVKNPQGEEVWNSGLIEDAKSVGIPYEGPDLQLESRYTWSVETTLSNGKNVRSQPAYFETGTNFEQAEWISNKETAADYYTDKMTVSLDATIIQGGFSLNWGMKNKTNGYIWSFNGTTLTQSVTKNGVTVQLGTADLSGKVALNEAFELEISADSDQIITAINGTAVNTIAKSHSIEGPFIAVTASPSSRNTPAQKASFEHVELTVDDAEEQVTEFDGAVANESGVWTLEGATAYQKTFNGAPVVYTEDTNALPMFRTEQELQGSGDIASARLYITSLGAYDAYINGQEVQVLQEDGTKLDDTLNPGWTDYYSYTNYQSYDVTDYISGDHVALGVAVGAGWYGGEAGSNGGGNLYYKIGDELERELALLAKLVVTYEDGTQEIIGTNNEDWKVTTDGPVRLHDLFVGEVYDARLEDQVAGWNNAGFDDSGWNGAAEFQYDGRLAASRGAAAYVLEENKIHPVPGEDTFIFDPADIDYSDSSLTLGEVKRTPVDPTGTIELPKGKSLMIDLGQNIAGVPGISVSGAEGTTVHMRGAEMLNDGRDHEKSTFGSDGPKGTLYWSGLTRGRAKDQTWYTDHYILNDQPVQSYSPRFTFHGFRYLEITATEDVVVRDVYGQAITSAVENTLSLETNNEDLNQLFSNVLWSQRSNFLSIPTDTPGRSERLGWTGDIQVFGETALYNFDSVAFLENFVGILKDYAEQNNGYIADYLPTISKATTTNAGWSDVIITLPWDLYMHTGDISILRDTYDIMKVYMGNVMANGMRAGYGDWVAMQGTAPQFMAAMYQALDAVTMAKIATLLGHDDDAAMYTAESERVIDLAYDKYVDENDNILSVTADNFTRGFLINLFKDNSQTSILWALKMGMYESEEQKRKFIENLLLNIANENKSERSNSGENTLSTGFLGVNELLPVLTENELSAKAYDLLLQDEMPSWLYEVKQGATTTWERWNAYTSEYGFDDNGMNSFNHYAYGAVVEWMTKYMAGIQSDEQNAGFKHFILQPTLDTGDQYNDQARIRSVKGKLDSYYGTIVSNWESEDGTLGSYEAIVPANTTATLYLPIDDAAVRVKGTPGIKHIENLERYGVQVAKFELQSGGYQFSVKNGMVRAELMDGFVNSKGKASLAGPSLAGEDESFSLTYRLAGVESISAQDVTIDYDKTRFEFVGAESLIADTQIEETKNDTSGGSVRLIVASLGADRSISGDADVMKLTFKSKKASGTGNITLSEVKVSNGDGEVFQTEASGKTVTLDANILNSVRGYDIGDLGVIAFNYGKTAADAAWDAIKKADLNGDGVVGLSDLGYIARKILK
ncbi:family 78 glycoside hydrolase catalytic domain [Paenibacillus sp. N4]|uniref:family 78 glycoside hydrolase catalytic domain n=1 Tax=Paenibacillus vietnamensis TaxID=2590547 RepID=UPI001CD0DA21|nr:family 78 glycoside hydrolase catalytic domain [Paenibacillus vietnamensis]MCA0757846.1 family 78 glycoside hydrolase catalytic domain [Paenibacillus vietnamensis]